jgi:hypothetical protein
VQWPKRPNISHRQEGWRGKHLTDESIKKLPKPALSTLSRSRIFAGLA